MGDRSKSIYRSNSLRLEGFDYGSEAIYFITICTQDKVNYFGNIQKLNFIPSLAGSIVASEWKKTDKLRPRAVLGEWVVMPNHFHALIYLKPKGEKRRDGLNPSKLNSDYQKNNYKNKFGPQSNNLSSVIRGFKSTCTRQIRKIGLTNFSWLRGYYDHIVRNQKALIKIEEYIRENPQKWIEDEYYK